MKPDRTNYEIWLIDYLDGNLDDLKVRQLISFLEENPDIREECEDILSYNLKPETGSFKYKSNLKKSVTDLNQSQFEYLCISAAENDITEQQRIELASIVADNPEKKKTFELYKRLKLVAPVVTYNSKPGIRRLTTTQKIVRLSVVGLSAAAGLAIMISLYNIQPEKEGSTPSFVSANLSGDTVIKESQSNKIIAYNPPLLEKELQQSARKDNIVSPVETVSPLVESLAAQPLTADSTPVDTESRTSDIEKINFIKDVTMIEKGFTGELIAINTINNESFVETPDKPGFNEFIAKTFRERILKSKTPETGSLKAYEIADAGINGLNKLLGWDMSLQKTRDEKGALKSLYFSSKMLKFNAPVKKVQVVP
jgi:hypothetical protein